LLDNNWIMISMGKSCRNRLMISEGLKLEFTLYRMDIHEIW